LSRKPFDPKLYKANDARAKQYFRSVLPSGLTAEVNERKTGVDLLVYKGSQHLFYAEVEVKNVWGDETFKYETLHLPHRKSKYVGLEVPTLFTIFNAVGNRYFMFWDRFLAYCKVIEVHNKFVRCGEMFYDIPIKYLDQDIEKALRRKWKRKIA